MPSYTRLRRAAAIAAALVLVPVLACAQTAGRQGQAGRGQRAQGAGQKPALPPIGRGMNAMQLQQYIDAFALIQAEQQLKLGADQYAAFAPKLIRMHRTRQRLLQDRRRALAELNQLLMAQSPNDEAITEKTRAFDDVNRRGAEELVKSYQDLDSVLTPWQRGRFRLLEEQMERKKLELLTRLGPPVVPDGK
jgi:Spy/CpxP family protein refolding chaperone